MKVADYEKKRLEEKQRAVRKYKEKNHIEHIPFYFVEAPNVYDNNENYWRYNSLYFENDREK